MKILLISQRLIFPAKGAPRNALESDYVEYFSRFGVLLVGVPNLPELVDSYFEAFDIAGLILSGGNNITPNFYNGSLSPTSDCAPERDLTEKKLLDKAIELKLPVFCQCRGLQFLNAYFGGSLRESLSDSSLIATGHVATDHPIQIVDSETAELFGAHTVTVNSFHSQGFTSAELANDLRVFAEASDDTVEGVYHQILPIAGVMWHPERKSPNEDFNKKIIKMFLAGEHFWAKR